MLCRMFFSGCSSTMYSFGVNRHTIVTVADKLRANKRQFSSQKLRHPMLRFLKIFSTKNLAKDWRFRLKPTLNYAKF
jgi:hypothetical protein